MSNMQCSSSWQGQRGHWSCEAKHEASRHQKVIEDVFTDGQVDIRAFSQYNINTYCILW